MMREAAGTPHRRCRLCRRGHHDPGSRLTVTTGTPTRRTTLHWVMFPHRVSSDVSPSGLGTTVWLIDNCMVAAGLAGIWHKSSYSNPCGSCVEVTPLADGRIAVRHSRHPSGPVLICPRAEMAAFLHSTRVGQFGDRSTAPEIDSAGPTMPMPPSRPPR